MNINEISAKLEAAGCEVKIWNDERVYVRSTPNGGRSDYGYLVDGDDGGTGSCRLIVRRKGEIAAILRS